MEQQYCNVIMPGFGPPSSQLLPEEGYSEQKKKLKLRRAQRDLLEKTFSEGIRLDPARKAMLATELGLDPRQVAVWFQNRRSRWKAKQLELSHLSLKLQLDAVSLENQKLQHQVAELSAMVMQQAAAMRNANQISMEEEAVRMQERGIAAEYHSYMLNGSYWAAYPPT